METISGESSDRYEDYYDLKNSLPKTEREEDYTVVRFDGNGATVRNVERQVEKNQSDKFSKVITYLKNHKYS